MTDFMDRTEVMSLWPLLPPNTEHVMDYRVHILRDLLKAARPCVCESADEWQRLADEAGEDAVFALDARHHITRLRNLIERIDDELVRRDAISSSALTTNWCGAMSNSNYTRGRRYEYKTAKLLEESGYEVVRSASSKGPWDICAAGRQGIRLVSVKSGDRPYLPPVERESLKELAKAVWGKATVECWFWTVGERSPYVEVL